MKKNVHLCEGHGPFLIIYMLSLPFNVDNMFSYFNVNNCSSHISFIYIYIYIIHPCSLDKFLEHDASCYITVIGDLQVVYKKATSLFRMVVLFRVA